ncbi:cysteine desulfurase [Formicincola oecophyllae]|uniref:Cysteine desulfurase n=1 Tax=Formicincola oecophyllae TaxID=2558361 RepID=A0A4Y6UAN5_9PROT|nr:cysteine desulfurase family protein [Formicincola oecophyllae]QDH13451.1 cysteine desulfurase [Formicincola oecophyllae]
MTAPHEPSLPAVAEPEQPSGGIYLDYMATTPCDPAVVEAMLPWFGAGFGNASSQHEWGRQARDAVEGARAEVAALIGAEPREIIFTSGATEANNLAIKGGARYRLHKEGGAHPLAVVTQATEHKCVLESVRSLGAEGFTTCQVGVDLKGLVLEGEFAKALAGEARPAVVSIMAANNETGVLQNIKALSAQARDQGALFHSDLAQAAGKVDIPLESLDLASLSAHKLYGPKGIGALYVRRRPRARLEGLFSGGGQERGLRSGTLPVPLIVGFGVAARLMLERKRAESQRLACLRQQLWDGLSALWPGLRWTGHGAPMLPQVLNACLPAQVLGGHSTEALLATVPLVGASTGSACQAGSGAPSYVLCAMGLTPGDAQRSLRLSVGRFTREAEIDQAVGLLAQGAAQLRAASSPPTAQQE